MAIFILFIISIYMATIKYFVGVFVFVSINVIACHFFLYHAIMRENNYKSADRIDANGWRCLVYLASLNILGNPIGL